MTNRRSWLGIAAVMIGLGACSKTPDVPPAPSGPPRFELASSDPVKHGERLSKVLGCRGCHEADLTGQDWSDEMGTLWTANLTQSAARYSHDELAAMITAGKRADRALIDMPSYLFSGLNPADVDAMVAYLKTLKPEGPVHPEPSMGPELLAMQAKGEWIGFGGARCRHERQGPARPRHEIRLWPLHPACNLCGVPRDRFDRREGPNGGRRQCPA